MACARGVYSNLHSSVGRKSPVDMIWSRENCVTRQHTGPDRPTDPRYSLSFSSGSVHYGARSLFPDRLNASPCVRACDVITLIVSNGRGAVSMLFLHYE